MWACTDGQRVTVGWVYAILSNQARGLHQVVVTLHCQLASLVSCDGVAYDAAVMCTVIKADLSNLATLPFFVVRRGPQYVLLLHTQKVPPDVLH